MPSVLAASLPRHTRATRDRLRWPKCLVTFDPRGIRNVEMNHHSGARRHRKPSQSSLTRTHRQRRRLAVEILEHRRVLAVAFPLTPSTDVTDLANATRVPYLPGPESDSSPIGPWIFDSPTSGVDASVNASTPQTESTPSAIPTSGTDPATLLVDLASATVNETDGIAATTLTITRNGDLSAALDVTLVSSDTTAATLPSVVTIPATQSFVTVDVSTHNDYFVDATQSTDLTASATGFLSDTATLEVTNDDTAGNRTIGGHFEGLLPSNDYTVTFDVVVDAGEHWQIEPGSNLLFETDTQLLINGSVEAIGTQTDPIVFTSAAATPTAGDWVGIDYNAENESLSEFRFVDIAYGLYGLNLSYIDSPSVEVSNSEFHDNLYDGMMIRAGRGDFITLSDVTVQNSKFYNNGEDGLTMHSAGGTGATTRVSARIHDNEFYNNTISGLHIVASYAISFGTAKTSATSPNVLRNHIHGNDIGIKMRASEGGGSAPFGASNGALIVNNIIEQNTTGVEISHSGPTTQFSDLLNNTIVNNVGTALSHTTQGATGDTNLEIRNNNIAFNGLGIEATAAFTPNLGQIGFNNVFQNAGGNWGNYPADFGSSSATNANGTASDAEQNISVDPLFLLGTLYQQDPASSINDAGTTNDAPGTDYLQRYRQPNYDIGAYEHDFVGNAVTTIADEDDGGLGLGTGDSLRELINAANARGGHDEIVFDPTIFGETITLASVLPTISTSISILGPGADQITISGNGSSRIFHNTYSGTVLSGLTLRDADDSAILSPTTLTVRDSVIRNSSGTNGGAINATNTLTLERTSIVGNTADSAGGGIYSRFGPINVIDSAIHDNVTLGQGGGVSTGGTVNVFNSTISGNSAATHGAGISSFVTKLRNVTLAFNHGDSDGNGSGNGGGINTNQLTAYNSLIAGNLSGLSGASWEINASNLIDAQHNLVWDAATSGGITDGVDGNLVGFDPLLVPLAENGGPTQTHRLMPSSPAVDSGLTELATDPSGGPLTTDQRGIGFQRVVDGNRTGTPIVDIGAFEAPPAPPAVDSVIINGGDAQRSSLKEVELLFNFEVEIDQSPGNDAFQFVNLDTLEQVTDVPVITHDDGKTRVRFTFAQGPSVLAGGSLADGSYQLTIDSALVHLDGTPLDGDGDGIAGGQYHFGATEADGFFRKYGDQDGNDIVNLFDFAAFRNSYAKSANDLGYVDSLDADNNQTINLFDFAAFRNNFGQ